MIIASENILTEAECFFFQNKICPSGICLSFFFMKNSWTNSSNLSFSFVQRSEKSNVLMLLQEEKDFD